MALLHAGIAFWLLSRPKLVISPVLVPAIMIELAPEPAVPAPDPSPAPELPTAPAPTVQQMLPPPPADPVPPEAVREDAVVPDPVPEMKVDAPAVPEPAVPLPPPPRKTPKPRPKPAPRAVRNTAPAPAPPVAATPVDVPPRAAPGSSAAHASSAAATSWQAQLVARLNRYKRYPSSAQMQRQEGVAYLRFTMNRGGIVVRYSLERSSGHELLDKETLALIERAQPLPTPPADVGGSLIELIVPLRFHLN